MIFSATGCGIEVIIELEGHTPPRRALPHVRVQLFAGGPNESRHELARDVWGVELLYQLHRDIYRAAKAAKPDCLVNSSTVHPYFHDVLDQVRLHDIAPSTPRISSSSREAGGRPGRSRCEI